MGHLGLFEPITLRSSFLLRKQRQFLGSGCFGFGRFFRRFGNSKFCFQQFNLVTQPLCLAALGCLGRVGYAYQARPRARSGDPADAGRQHAGG